MFFCPSIRVGGQIASTNMMERLNEEILYRTRVVGIFPNPDSYVRLVTTYLMEYSEDGSISHTCICIFPPRLDLVMEFLQITNFAWHYFNLGDAPVFFCGPEHDKIKNHREAAQRCGGKGDGHNVDMSQMRQGI